VWVIILVKQAEVREKAFYLYSNGISYEKIAKTVGIGKATVSRWVGKYSWEKKKQELSQIVEKNDKKDNIELSKLILKQVKQTWLKNIESGKIKLYTSDVLAAIKLEKELADTLEVSERATKYELKLVYPEGYKRKIKKKIDEGI
jgi:transposase